MPRLVGDRPAQRPYGLQPCQRTQTQHVTREYRSNRAVVLLPYRVKLTGRWPELFARLAIVPLLTAMMEDPNA
jgi:hypothetical protein